VSVRDTLRLTDVQVARVTETADGMGGVSAATTLTTLSRAAIWQIGSANRYISDKIARSSTHLLAVLPGEYSWADRDDLVIYDGKTFRTTGHDDDVMQRGEISLIGLERTS